MRLPGLRTATKRLADGSRRVYAYLGGECLAAGSGATLEAANADLAERLAAPDVLARVADLQAPRRPMSTRYVSGLVEAFLASPEYRALGASSRREYRAYLDAFRAEFGTDRLAAWEDPRIVTDLTEWRDAAWPDAPRAADYAMTANALAKQTVCSKCGRQGPKWHFIQDHGASMAANPIPPRFGA